MALPGAAADRELGIPYDHRIILSGEFAEHLQRLAAEAPGGGQRGMWALWQHQFEKTDRHIGDVLEG